MDARGQGIVDDGRTNAGPRWKAGDEILGRYVVEKELGQGGMGLVYECLDKVAGVKVAVKCLPPELAHNSVEMEEVRENFELVYKLNHPNIVAAKTLERDGKGEYFLVMDVAEGESLRRWMRRRAGMTGHGAGRGMPLAEAIPILRQVAAALDYAHGKKVIHRDVKPGNVMLDARTGEVKVLDFGLAAQIRTSLSRASQAYRGTSGTGPYMAPEQWEGSQQDAATDQYALGVMAYEMLAGHLPFENSELAVLKDAVLHGAVRDIPGVDKRAMKALRRALAKREEDRWESCGAFVAALAGEKAGGGASARGRMLLGWIAALVLAAAVGAGVWRWRECGTGEVRLAGEEMVLEKSDRPKDLPRQEDAQPVSENVAAEEAASQEDEQVKAELEKSATEAKAKLEAFAGRDRGQKFGARWEEAKSKLTQVEEAIRERNFEEAGKCFEESLAAATWLETNAPLCDKALLARSDAKEAKEKADELAGARSLSSYKSATQKAMEGKDAFDDARYEDATAAWNAAEAGYAQAQKVRKGLDAARGAERRGAWEEVKAAAKEVLALEPDNVEAKALLAEVTANERLAAARKAEEDSQWEEATSAAGEVLEAADELLTQEPGNEAAQQLKAEAARMLEPAFWVKVLLNGREVTAGVKGEGGGKPGEKLHAKEGESRTFTLEYEMDGQKYRGMATATANARGVTEVVVELEPAVVTLGRGTKAGETRPITLTGGATMEMVWCPPGDFMMGSPKGELGRDDVEEQHPVELTNGFWMAKTEVTQKQWKSVMGTTVREQADKDTPSPVLSLFGEGDDYPMYFVSWDEAQEFCRKAGHNLQLPTEAQWEYACRAGTTNALNSGKDLTAMSTCPNVAEVAWYSGNAEGETRPVGRKQTNAWGLCDMHGNVWEWCEDWYVRGYYKSIAPVGRVIRGGSWELESPYCRSARSSWEYPNSSRRTIGFRPVISPD